MCSDSNNVSRVYINEIGTDLGMSLQAGLDFINWETIITKGTRVLIKPNFTYPYYKEGITTSPNLLTQLLKIIRTKTDSVILAESNGSNNTWKAEQAFEGHNLYKICAEADVNLVNLSTMPSKKVSGMVLGKKVNVTLPRLLLEDIDCLISVPVVKVHAMTTISLSLKNLWGLVPDPMLRLQHQDLVRKLALIARLVKPKIIVIDGTYGLNKCGPMYGEPVDLGLLIIADNAVTADKIGANIMGFSPERIKHIQIAEKAGCGTKHEPNLNKDWRQYSKKFWLKRKTVVEWLTYLTFHSDILAKLVYDSILTKFVYIIVNKLRTNTESSMYHDVRRNRL